VSLIFELGMAVDVRHLNGANDVRTHLQFRALPSPGPSPNDGHAFRNLHSTTRWLVQHDMSNLDDLNTSLHTYTQAHMVVSSEPHQTKSTPYQLHPKHNLSSFTPPFVLMTHPIWNNQPQGPLTSRRIRFSWMSCMSSSSLFRRMLTMMGNSA